jgi:hypothetical protein
MTPNQAPTPGGQLGGGSAGNSGLGDLENLIGQGVQGITKLISSISAAVSGGGGGKSSEGGGRDLSDLTSLIGEGAKTLSNLVGAAGSAGDGLEISQTLLAMRLVAWFAET